MSHPIPDAALDDRLGFLGMTGSGKTFGAGTCVERILAKRGRVIVPDPLGVWWGLRLDAEGTAPSRYDVVIFGGPHGDLPITPLAGGLIGETVATMRESAIIDLSQFETSAAERRFMLAFLEAIYRKTTGEPVHLIFDEADQWAPERIIDKEGEATKLHNIMQTVVRRGRIKGLTSWLISQRPAALSKNVLSQVDGLVAFRLTASQDRKALGLWIEGQADREAGKAILARLPEKTQGEAVVWLPARGILDDVKFPAKRTYDSSRAPKRGEKRAAVELASLDIGALKEKLATVEAETKANDPKLLKAELARLRKELTYKSTIQPVAVDPHEMEWAEERGYVRGWKEGVQATTDLLAPKVTAVVNAARELLSPGLPQPPSGFKAVPKQPIHRGGNGYAAPARRVRQSAPPSGDISGPHQRIIDAIAWWVALGHPHPTRVQVAFVAGYKPNTGTYNTYLGALGARGLIAYPSRGRIALTDAGASGARAPSSRPDQHELLDRVRNVLSGPQAKLLLTLIERYPDPLSRDELAEAAGYAPNTGTFNTYLGSLSSLDIVSYPTRGQVQAAEWLFP